MSPDQWHDAVRHGCDMVALSAFFIALPSLVRACAKFIKDVCL